MIQQVGGEDEQTQVKVFTKSGVLDQPEIELPEAGSFDNAEL